MSSSEEHKERSATPGLNVDTALPAVSGQSRRSGVIWTNEARNDMFARREAGEGWESICRDYPSRSRHAMQQQYSMMKKQKMMAEGTWTTNRRGRKRKLPVPGVAGFQRRESGMDDTENDMSVTPSDLEPEDGEDMLVDDIDMGTPGPEITGPAVGGVQSVLDFNRDPHMSGRPSPLSRSATDPAPAVRGRGRGRGRVPSSSHFGPPDNGPLPLAPKGFTPVNPSDNGIAKPGKRTLTDTASLSPAAKRQRSLTETGVVEDEEAEMDALPNFSQPCVLFTQAQVADFFRVGVERHERVKGQLDSEHAHHADALAEAQARANRRIREVEDRIKELTYRHRSDIRVAEEGQRICIEEMKEEHENKIKSLEAELIVARGDARPAYHVKDATSVAQESASGQKGNTNSAYDNEIFLKLANALEDLRPRYDAEQARRKKAETRIATLEQQVAANSDRSGPSVEMVAQFRQLEGLLKALEAEAGDLSPRALTQRLIDANLQCARLARFVSPHSQPAQPPPHGHFTSSPRILAPPSALHTIQAQAHNATLAAHNAQRPLPGSVSSSPAPDYKPSGPSPTSRPATLSSSDPPNATASADNKRPYAPISINSLMSQQPTMQSTTTTRSTTPSTSLAQNVLPPISRSPFSNSPQSRPPPPPSPAPPVSGSQQHVSGQVQGTE